MAISINYPSQQKPDWNWVRCFWTNRTLWNPAHHKSPCILPSPMPQYGRWWFPGRRSDGLQKALVPNSCKILLEIVYHHWMRKLNQRSVHRYLPKDRKVYERKPEALIVNFQLWMLSQLRCTYHPPTVFSTWVSAIIKRRWSSNSTIGYRCQKIESRTSKR